MAIKRSSKGKGTLSHKPVASAPLRHVDVRAPQQMVLGEVYAGWLCEKPILRSSDCDCGVCGWRQSVDRVRRSINRDQMPALWR